MTDSTTHLETLRRPRLLVRAARHGVPHYNRGRDLRRIAGRDGTLHNGRLVRHLIECEEELEATRREKCATYSAARHIELLTALIAESQPVPEPAPAPIQTRPPYLREV